MIALCVIVGLLLLFLILPVGVDAAYQAGSGVSVKAKAGSLLLDLVPAKPKQRKAAEKKPRRRKQKKKTKKQEKAKLGPRDIRELAAIAVRTLARFRKYLRIDALRLFIICAADDPFETIERYGYLNAVFYSLSPLVHNLINIRDEDIRLSLDVTPGKKTAIDARVVATLQIWEILSIAACAGVSLLRLSHRRKREAREKRAAEETDAGMAAPAGA